MTASAKAPRLAAVAVTLGAVLLFGVEPLVGQLVLPQLGGAAAVWTTCLMVFQVTLLGAYLYAHLVAPRIGGAHLIVIALPLVWMPLEIQVAPSTTPLWALLWALATTVVPPFFALATTAVVVQSWLASKQQEPYRLYALSNAGSLGVLLAYPVLIQPLLGNQVQTLGWSFAYACWWLTMAATWWALRPEKPTQTAEDTAPWGHSELSWGLLAAGPSALLLAVTNVLTVDAGPYPLLWVMPLALYLGTFVVAFSGRWPHKAYAQWWPEWVLIALVLSLATAFATAWLPILGAFTVLSLLAHGALYALRPEPARLTRFYLVTAAGGAAAGVLVTLGAPLAFTRLTEYPLAVALVGLGLAMTVGAPWSAWRRAVWVPGSRPNVLVLLALAYPLGASLIDSGEVVDEARSFYGLLRVDEVVDGDGRRVRRLVSGHTVHGGVYTQAEPEPLHYYAEGGPLYQALSQRRAGPTHLGMIGLGTGAMAFWADADDQMSFYEIDPESARLARRWFPFIDASPSDVRVHIGDGRLRVASDREVDAEPFDMLLVDAFAGDAIPTHLLTLEAVKTYSDHMRPDGLLVFHISSNALDLSGVLATVAAELGHAVAYFPGQHWNPEKASYARSDVLVMTQEPSRLEPLLAAGWLVDWDVPESALWTDDYVNRWQPLRAAWNRP
ncbi:MAG: fused MFS/spermidine synthase [Proteobacteria bacterium]|nr:fused MFS/spermidine synthase [Pseudomonadota bacterium]